MRIQERRRVLNSVKGQRPTAAEGKILKRYVGELKTELKDKQDKTREKNREIEEGVFTATADPTKKYVPPTKEEVAPFLNFAPLENGSAAYERAAQRYKSAFSKLAGANPLEIEWLSGKDELVRLTD